MTGYDKSSTLAEPQECEGGKVWKECASEDVCQQTCENYDVPVPCPRNCAPPKCQCPHDKPIWHEGQCVEKEVCMKLGKYTLCGTL